jgi:hypothetical protein
MGLIGDRRSKKQKEKEKEIERLRNGQNALNNNKKKGGLVGGGPVMVGRYPAGYYTTPNPGSSSWARHGGEHPAQPRHQPNLNPRYQTWVAPRKQQSLSSLVSGRRPMTRSGPNYRRRPTRCRPAGEKAPRAGPAGGHTRFYGWTAPADSPRNPAALGRRNIQLAEANLLDLLEGPI